MPLTEAYGEGEQAVAWLTCIEAMFGRFKQVRLLGNEVALVGFDLRNHDVVAVCQQGKRKARVTLDSIEFSELTTVEQLWLQAWKRFSATNGCPAGNPFGTQLSTYVSGTAVTHVSGRCIPILGCRQ